MVVMFGREERSCPVVGRRKTLGNLALFLQSNDTLPSLTQFPVPAERDHVAMLASVTHYDSEIPASLNQGLSLLLHEVRVSSTFLLDYKLFTFFLIIEVIFPHFSD